ncbi:DUF6452 family protein [Thermophagus sp. OGC60D27]|uniref:DUF6452 family protein n=1 Tax=Thermophagus sp. OGC60D27 TaxID=3458415 RepID=UPI004037A924
MKFVNYLFFALIILLAVVACNDDEACLSNQHSVQANLLSAWWAEDTDTTLTEVSIIGLNMADSIYKNESLSDLFLPLSFQSDTSSFIISSKTLKDTLHIISTKELDFISGECGYIFTFDLDTVIHTNAFIDSVSIIYPKVKYGETTENIKLYIY